MRCLIWKFTLPVLVAILCSRLPAEERPQLPSTTPEVPGLHSLATRSGYAFAGTVKSVERIKPHRKDSVSVMRITFHVDKGYRGVRTGQTISIHEWAGLWEAGERYRAGERVVLFLYPPSKLGLTSPVENGRFPVDSSGQVVVPSVRPPSVSPPVTSPAPSQLPSGVRISLQDLGLALKRAEKE